MSEPTTVVDTYLAMWNEDDSDRRADLIEQAWTTEGAYIDPLLQATGHAELTAMVDGVHEQYPGYKFRRTSGVGLHLDTVRFGWELFGPEGTILVAGIDVGQLAADGKLRSITGFF